MTEPKTLTPAEALRALAEGKKLRRADFHPGEFMTLNDGCIVDHLNLSRMVSKFTGLTLFTEPKPKVTWVEYLCTPIETDSLRCGSLIYLKRLPEPSTIWHYTPTGRKIEV